MVSNSLILPCFNAVFRNFFLPLSMAQKKLTRKIILSVAETARNPQNRLHIISRYGGKWVVKKEGAKRASGVYPTIEKAIEVATASVKAGKTKEALVHDMYGEVSRKIV